LQLISNISHGHQNNYFCAGRRKDSVRGATSAAQGPIDLCPRDVLWKIMLGSLLPLAIGRKIGRHYQPKQKRDFVVLITIMTFHARCSGAGGRPGSQLRVDQGWDLTTGHYGSKRKEDWTALPATTEELCCFGYFHDRCSGAGGRPRQKLTATSRSRVASDQ
jgi:hypothetical protein